MRNNGFRAKSKGGYFNKSQYQTETKVLYSPIVLIH